MKTNLVLILGAFLIFYGISTAQVLRSQSVGGTLVVAVPVHEGLVACSDKRLFNETTGTFRDDSVKIHRVGNDALFVVTNTTGFLDTNTGKLEFNVFDIVSRYASPQGFDPSKRYWDGLTNELKRQLLQYLSHRNYKDWPETDTANNRLLFNLVFYAIRDKQLQSYSITAFYEKAPTPVIYIQEPVAGTVRSPQLLGKGKAVMTYLSRDPKLSRDPAILRFDESVFDSNKTTIDAAMSFADELFLITNKALPMARVSQTFDCALLGYQSGFRWLTTN